MAFTQEQLKALNSPLDAKHVKSRTQQGRTLSYIEGWQALAKANEIFGHDSWSRATFDVQCVSEATRMIGKPPNQYEGWGVTYVARVRIPVIADGATIVREGCGTGHGIDRDKGQAHESAIKEAETDATKRALMTFGWPFGLALYDKSQEHVTNGNGSKNGAAAPEVEELPKAKSRPIYDALIKEMRACKTAEATTAWALVNTSRIYSMHADFQRWFRDEYKNWIDALKEGATETEEGHPI